MMSKSRSRRSSMTEVQEQERRASIKAIMLDTDLSPQKRRLSIQALMDGRRNSAGFQSQQSKTNATATVCSRRMEDLRLKCTHYDRNCTIISPCCGAAFGCRICHDECPILPPQKYGTGAVAATSARSAGRSQRRSSMPLSFAQDAVVEHHKIDRFAIREVICRECFTRQSSKTNECINCHIQFGEYHCSTCNLWMAEEESPYHCAACGFCRVGAAENFRHCYNCDMCIGTTLFADHNCKVGKYMSNCPVCQEDLFSSRAASHEMPCGHTIHWHCFQELAAYDSRCPVCKKTVETPDKMMEAWSALAMDIAMQPIPPELSKVVSITCNDCETSDDGLGWHFLGVQCEKCLSFNTSVDRVAMVGHQAYLYLARARELEALGQADNDNLHTPMDLDH